MKLKRCLSLFLAPAFLLPVFSPPAVADSLPPTWSGEFSLLMGARFKKSNFNTDEEFKGSPLNSDGDRESKFAAIPLGQIRYSFGAQRRNQLFLGSSREDIIAGLYALEIGYQRRFQERSSIAVSVLPTVISGKTWEDPYLVNQDREETDVTGNAFRIHYRNILDSSFSLDMAYYNREIDKERSGVATTGTLIEALERDGDGVYIKGSVRLPVIRSGYLEPAIYFNDFEADGEAMSNNRIGAGLTFAKVIDRHKFAITGRYEKVQYDTLNPIFEEEQEDDGFKVSLAYEYEDVLGYDGWSLNAILGYSTVDSNIDFYNSESGHILFGASYKF